jgi:single-strand DNA-binding protein
VSLRVASTPRYLKAGDWVDGQTSWYTVNCWRSLARNVKDSVRRGDAVIVHGRVRVEAWSREGEPERTTWSVDARFLGHDLTRGTSAFVKTVRSAGEEAAPAPAGAAPAA